MPKALGKHLNHIGGALIARAPKCGDMAVGDRRPIHHRCQEAHRKEFYLVNQIARVARHFDWLDFNKPHCCNAVAALKSLRYHRHCSK